MNFLKKIIAVIGKGPTAVATAGVIGTSVSFPNVIDSVGPGCLGNMNGVGDFWVSGSRWTNVARGNKSGDVTSEWDGLGGIKEGDVGIAQRAFPCYSFLTTYGGANMAEQSEKENNLVSRACPNKIWERVKKSVEDTWTSFEMTLEKEKKKEWEKLKDKIKQVKSKIGEAKNELEDKKMWTIMTEIKELASEIWSNRELNENQWNHNWWQTNGWNGGKYKMGDDRWPDLFEYGAKKIINLEEKFKVEGDKLKQGLSNNPTFCAST